MMSTDTMYFNSSRSMPSHRGRHQKQTRLQKPDRRMENQIKLRKQQSAEPPVVSNQDHETAMSQFAYSGYGNQGTSLTTASSEAMDTMGFVSDDLKQLLSMTDSNKKENSSPQLNHNQQQQQPLPVSNSPRLSPSGTYQQSPLPPNQGLYGPMMVPPPFLMSNVPKLGPHPYAGIANGPGMLPMYVPMNAGRPINQPPAYPQAMYNATHQQGIAFPPQQLFQHQQLHSSQPQPQQVQQVQQQKLQSPAPNNAQITKSSVESQTVVGNTEQTKQPASDNKQISKSPKEESRQQRSENSSSHSKTKSSKKRNARKNDSIPPQQVPVSFSSPSAPSSRSSKSSNKKSNHMRSESRSDDHSKCYAGATFATEAPQVTTLPKPSFV